MPTHHDVVDGQIDGMLAVRPFQLVGLAFQRLRAVQRFGHVDHVAVRRLLRQFRRLGGGLFGGLGHAQHRSGHVIGPVGGAALAAGLVGFHVDRLERLEGDVLGAVDGLGDGAVDPFLRRRLHPHMFQRRKGLGVHEILGQIAIAEAVAPHLHGVIDHLFFGAAAILLQHLAGIGIGKDGLDPRRHVARIKRNRAGGRDGGQQRIADAMVPDGLAHVVIHGPHGAGGKIFVRVEQRESALFLRQLHRGQIGGAGDAVQPALGLTRRLLGAVAQPHHQQRIGKPGDPQTDAALVLRLFGLRGQRKARGIHHIVHHPHGGGHQIVQIGLGDLGARLERLAHQTRKVDRPQQAGAIRRQRLFATGVGGGDLLDIGQIVGLIDAVDEDHARFGVIIGGLHDAVPQIPRLHGLVDLAAELQIPRGIRLHRFHERIGDQHRQVEHAQPGAVGFGGDELFDVGMVAAHRGHHRAAAAACGHDGAAHGVPDIHEAQRAGGIGSHAAHRRALGPDGGEIITDPPALLHGQRRLFQHVENAGHAVGDGAHDEAVEQRHAARGAGTRCDPTGGQVFEILQRRVELRLPQIGLVLDRGQSAGDAAPAVLHGLVDGRAIRILEAVFHVPDLFGNGGGKASHGSRNPW